MERVFKHRKTGEIAYYKDGIFKSGNCSIEIGREPSSDIWEEEKYELLSWIDKKGNVYENREPVASILGNNSFYITSIKRLSDGEIFTVGDKAKTSKFGTTGTISQISTEGGSLYFSSEECVWGAYLESMIKPVLITVDGVDLYKGDYYWFFWTKNPARGQEINKIYKYKVVPLDSETNWSENAMFFSSEIAAKNYLRDNEKKYSLNDIVSVVNHWAYIKNINPDKILKYLENNGK